MSESQTKPARIVIRTEEQFETLAKQARESLQVLKLGLQAWDPNPSAVQAVIPGLVAQISHDLDLCESLMEAQAQVTRHQWNPLYGALESLDDVLLKHSGTDLFGDPSIRPRLEELRRKVPLQAQSIMPPRPTARKASRSTNRKVPTISPKRYPGHGVVPTVCTERDETPTRETVTRKETEKGQQDSEQEPEGRSGSDSQSKHASQLSSLR